MFFDLLISEPETTKPRLHSTSAMPLMPMPPIADEMNSSYVSKHFVSAPRSGRRFSRRHLRGHGFCSSFHFRDSFMRSEQFANLICESFACEIRLQDHLRGAGILKSLCILPLMIVRSCRQRYHDRRLSGRSKLCTCCGSPRRENENPPLQTRRAYRR